MEQRSLYFFELTVSGLCSALLHRLLGWKVGYFRISPFLANNRLFNRLNRFGFEEIFYGELPEINLLTKTYIRSFREIFSTSFSLPELRMAIDRHFLLNETAQSYTWRGQRQSLQMKWYEFSLVGCHLAARTSSEATYWRGLPSGMARAVASGIPNFPKISEPGLIEYLGYAASLAYQVAARVFLIIASRMQVRPPNSSYEAAAISPKPSPANYEIIYFPHKGVAYGELFAKDQYYSNDPDSPFRAQKILHLATSHADEPSPESLKYYSREQIPFDSFDHFTESGLRWEFRTATEFLRMALNAGALNWTEIWRWQGYRLAAYFFVFRALKRNISAVSLLARARLALVGYDVLFSPWLSAALSNAGIRTVATQERFILPFYMLLDAFVDVYLVSGPPVMAVIEENPESFARKEIVVIGPPRADDIRFWNSRGAGDPKYSAIRKKGFLILALDHVAPASPDANRVARAATWGNIRAFYTDLLRLADAFPEAHIVLKGKDASNKVNPYLADLVSLIDQKANIEIETALRQYPPAYLAGIADMAVAMHTSLGDEMLAAGKPCVFYDRMGYLQNLYEYADFPVIVRSYDDLERKVGEVIRKGAGAFMDWKTFESFRTAVFGEDGSPVRERVQIQLIRQYEKGRNQSDLLKGERSQSVQTFTKIA